MKPKPPANSFKALRCGWRWLRFLYRGDQRKPTIKCAIVRKAKENFKMNDSVRLLNHDCDSLTYGGVSYTPDASGSFNVPRDVADVVVRQPGGFYRGPDVAPPPRSPLPFNPVFNVSGGVTVADDLSGRVLVLELAHAARLGLDAVPFVDSTGKRTVLSTAECRALSGEYRARLLASL